MAIKQQDIADYLGVSRQVVGNALSGTGRIAEETRQRVLQAARDLGYSEHANQAARTLAAQRYRSRSRLGIFGVLLPQSEGESKRKAPYFIDILDGIEEQADAMELGVFLHSFRAGYIPRYISNFLLDGLINVATSNERSEWMYLHGLPQVLIDASHDNISCIRADQEAGVALCTQHLIDLGHRRICYFSQDTAAGMSFSRIRFDSFAAVMAGNGLTVDPERCWYQCHRMQRESAKEEMAHVLKTNPDFTALVCYNDLLAMGAIDALRDARKRVPDDVSVTGFDDNSGAYGFGPEITSVAFDRVEVGRQAVRMLYDYVDAANEDPLRQPQPQSLVMPTRFVIHRSTAPAAAP